MKQLICDRCGKEITESQGTPVFAVIRTNTFKVMDMCTRCRKHLIAFMHDVPLDFSAEDICGAEMRETDNE